MRQWTVDAFTSQPFGGNPACVVEPLDAWPSDTWMQQLASENRAGATAFITPTPSPGRFGLRWFTPTTEVPLCGHATLAAAHVLVRELGLPLHGVVFETRSGLLSARAHGEAYELTLPVPPFRRIATPPGLARALGAEPSEVWEAPYLIALFDDPGTITKIRPCEPDLMNISLAYGGQGNVGVASIAPASTDFDVVDRFFAPGYGIAEDAATGSFHAILTPLLAPRFGSIPIRFHQASGRGGKLTGRVDKDHAIIGGHAVTVAASSLRVRAQPA